MTLEHASQNISFRILLRFLKLETLKYLLSPDVSSEWSVLLIDRVAVCSCWENIGNVDHNRTQHSSLYGGNHVAKCQIRCSRVKVVRNQTTFSRVRVNFTILLWSQQEFIVVHNRLTSNNRFYCGIKTVRVYDEYVTATIVASCEKRAWYLFREENKANLFKMGLNQCGHSVRCDVWHQTKMPVRIY